MASSARPRVTSLDALRGLVMVIMALDHVRDFFHADAMQFAPENISRTTPAIFLTRWVTHICAPTFVFAAGAGAYLRLQRDGSKSALARFLVTRGLWLIAIEITLMRLALNFTSSNQYPLFLLILWALGGSMLVLAALIFLPLRVLAVLSVIVLAGHNALDGLRASQFGALGPLWQILHQPGVFQIGSFPILVGYPVLPWIALMAAGFCFGQLFERATEERQRVLIRSGTALLALFLLLRVVNLYGDPTPWRTQPAFASTALSFLNVTKYPPSLAFVALTIGAALLILAVFERRATRGDHPLVLIGRVPLFFYVVHFWLIHVLAATAAYLQYGSASFRFLFSPLPSMGGARELFPADFGYPLSVVYVVWGLVLLVMYPLCRWFGALKFARPRWWSGYL